MSQRSGRRVEDAVVHNHPLQKKIRSLQELLDISRRLNSSLDLRTILKDLVHTSCTVLKAESASLLLLDEKTGELVFKVVSDEGVAARLEGLRLAPGEGIAGQVAATGTRRIVTNVDKDPDHCGRFDSISGLETRSVMAVPLAWRGQVYGVLELVNLTPYVRAEDVDHVETVASIAAQAVANAELMDTLRQHQAELVQSSKLASIGTIAAGVAHELNQPLTGIRTFTQLLLRKLRKGGLEPPELEDRLTRIDKQVDRMTRIIEHLQIFARQRRVAQQPLQLNDVVKDAFMMLDEQLRLRNIALSWHLAADLPAIKGDPVRLEEVVINLVSNARDAMEPQGGGILTVATRHFAERRQVVLEVGDSGQGIAAENLDRIFDPFFTTKEPGKGTGLGLSIVHGIVKEHQGHITLESRPHASSNSGTTFTILFPEYRPEAQASRADADGDA